MIECNNIMVFAKISKKYMIVPGYYIIQKFGALLNNSKKTEAMFRMLVKIDHPSSAPTIYTSILIIVTKKTHLRPVV